MPITSGYTFLDEAASVTITLPLKNSDYDVECAFSPACPYMPAPTCTIASSQE